MCANGTSGDKKKQEGPDTDDHSPNFTTLKPITKSPPSVIGLYAHLDSFLAHYSRSCPCLTLSTNIQRVREGGGKTGAVLLSQTDEACDRPSFPVRTQHESRSHFISAYHITDQTLIVWSLHVPFTTSSLSIHEKPNASELRTRHVSANKATAQHPHRSARAPKPATDLTTVLLFPAFSALPSSSDRFPPFLSFFLVHGAEPHPTHHRNQDHLKKLSYHGSRWAPTSPMARGTG